MNKYRAKPTVIDGHRFASQKEAKRYIELKLLERAKKISALTLQVKYPIMVKDKKVCTYIADFVYHDGDKQIIEDVKGFSNSLYRLKKKLFEVVYGLNIRET